jgi:hypothetical protein
VSDIPVDDEAPLVTSGISRSAGAQSFRGAHRGRVCVRVFIGVSVRACCERLRCAVSFSKKKEHCSCSGPQTLQIFRTITEKIGFFIRELYLKVKLVPNTSI